MTSKCIEVTEALAKNTNTLPFEDIKKAAIGVMGAFGGSIIVSFVII